MKRAKRFFTLKKLLIINCSLLILSSCSVQQKISRSANLSVLKDSSLVNAHLGISIYEPATGKYWYNYNGEKYFVPASNTKLPTCYAAMKYLGDSLVGLRYGIPDEEWAKNKVIVIQPAGDPSFLHPEFKNQPIFEFLNQNIKINNKKAGFYYDSSKVERWGNGWSWNDYDESYMAERNVFPILGNVITIRPEEIKNRFTPDFLGTNRLTHLLKTGNHYFDSLLNQRLAIINKENASSFKPQLKITRSISSNDFLIQNGETVLSTIDMPFVTNSFRTAMDVMADTFKTRIKYVFKTKFLNTYEIVDDYGEPSIITVSRWHKIHSQPTDSLLKPMMHRSDNFFAEQSLLMVSNELLGVMNDEKIIDTLLKTDFKNLPQKPRWADGSGLSRYNLFTPQDFVAILNKMKNEFGMDRIKVILPTGGEGTISNYYEADSGYIYAKTGTLSGVVALSGFLTTRKGKQLLFSVLVNNHGASSTAVRKAVEQFIQKIRQQY